MPLTNKAGALAIGSDYKPIPVGGSIDMSDLAGLEGPFSLGSGPKLLNPKGNAVQALIVCDGDWRIADNNVMSQSPNMPSAPGTGWFPVKAWQYLPVGVASGIQGAASTYIRAENGNVTCWILWVMVD